jgi:hypothetical protein
MPKNQPVKATIAPPTAIAKYPNWTTLNNGAPVYNVEAPPTVEVDVNDQTGVARVRVLPGYNANISEIRYTT